MANNLIQILQICVNACHLCYRAVSRQFLLYRKRLQWRYHNLRIASKRSEPISPSNSMLTDRIHRLPPEIRLQIYHHIFPRSYVVQPEFENGRLRVRFGLLTTNSTNSNTAVSSCSNATRNTLRTTLEDGGSFLHQRSPRIPVTKATAGRLIYGDGEAWYISQCPEFFGGGAFASLLQTSRTVHQEVVDILYSKHIFSFFGPEMLQLFLDRASFEGLRSVRCVHLAVPIQPQGSSMETALILLGRTMRRVNSEMIGLRHLSVEVVSHQGPPQDPVMLRSYVVEILRGLRLESLKCLELTFLVMSNDTSKKMTHPERGFEIMDISVDDNHAKMQSSTSKDSFMMS